MQPTAHSWKWCEAEILRTNGLQLIIVLLILVELLTITV